MRTGGGTLSRPLRDLGIWDLIYEHCSYFTAPSIHRLFREVGLPPREIYTAFGDQFLCVEASCDGEAPPESPDEIAEMAVLRLTFDGPPHQKLGPCLVPLDEI